MGNAVRNDGRYSGLRSDGREWPQMLVGTQEIAAYLRIHPDTARKMLRDGRLPGMKDNRGRWVIRRRGIDIWVLDAMAERMRTVDAHGWSQLTTVTVG